jgi:PAS domain S-box-containing protein
MSLKTRNKSKNMNFRDLKYTRYERALYYQEENKTERGDYFRCLFDDMLNALIMIDERGKIIDINKAACELFGYSKEELMDSSLLDLQPDEDYEIIQAAINRVVRNTIDFFGVTSFVTKNGKTIRTEGAGISFKVGGKIYILGSYKTIN